MDVFNTVFGAGVTIILVIIGTMALFSLVFGALCLHIATGLLRFDRRSFGRAFKTHFGLIVFSLLVYAGTRLMGLNPEDTPALDPGMGRWIVIGILVLVCFVPPLIVKAGYNCSFIAALVVGVLTGIVESALGTLLLFGLVITLIAVTPVNSKTDAVTDREAHSAPTQIHAETNAAPHDEELDRLVGQSFDTLRTQTAGMLLDVRVMRRENGKFVVRHRSGIARVDAVDLLRIRAEEGDGPQSTEE